MERKNNQYPQGEAARILVNFLEVSITSIVFLKGVYPSGAFERGRYMNLVVHKAIHPDLRQYIHSAVNGLFPFVEKGLVERVAVIFSNSDYLPLEKFIFKLQVNQSYASEVEETQFEYYLRSFLVKLSVSRMLTKVLPSDCRWEITAYFHASSDANMSNNLGSWIPSRAEQWQRPALITPIKSMRSEPLGLQLYLEHPSESDA